MVKLITPGFNFVCILSILRNIPITLEHIALLHIVGKKHEIIHINFVVTYILIVSNTTENKNKNELK